MNININVRTLELGSKVKFKHDNEIKEAEIEEIAVIMESSRSTQGLAIYGVATIDGEAFVVDENEILEII